MQAHRLLVDGNLVSEDGGLGQQARLVDGRRLQQLAHLALELLAVLRDRLRRALLHPADDRLDRVGPAQHVLRQLRALDLAHAAVGDERLVQHETDVGRDGLEILLRARHRQHVGELRKRRRRDLALEREHVLQLRQRGKVTARERFVDRDNRLLRPGALDCDEDVRLTAGD